MGFPQRGTRWLLAALAAGAFCAPGLSFPVMAGQVLPEPPDAAGHVVEPARAPSIGAILREVPRDLWRFVSPDTGAIVVVGGGAALVSHRWDAELVRALQRNARLNGAFKVAGTYGVFPAMLAGSFAVYGVGRGLGRQHMAVVGADLVRGQILSQLWVQGLKYAMQRERPDQTDRLSLPSGHAAGAFAAATTVARHYGWKGAIPAYIGATYVAASRVHDNRHYLSDVTFGAAMGIAAAHTVTVKAGRYGVHVAPSYAPGGVALNVEVGPGR